MPLSRSQHQVVLEQNADSTEFCPNEGSSLLAVGTYELQPDRTTRLGKIYLYSLACNDVTDASPSHTTPDSGGSRYRLDTLSVTDTSGIFDLKWRAETGRADCGGMLAASLADGTVKLFDCSPQEQCSHRNAAAGAFNFSETASCRALSSGMALSVAWSGSGSQTRKSRVPGTDGEIEVEGGLQGVESDAGGSSSSCMLATSGSDGHVSVMQVCRRLCHDLWWLEGGHIIEQCFTLHNTTTLCEGLHGR